MEMHISRGLLAAIRADAMADPAHERCGLLLGGPHLGGQRMEGQLMEATRRITAFTPAANVHPYPARHFELDPAVLIAAERAGRAGGPALLGHYHTHPSGPAIPSVADAAAALPDGRCWMIINALEATLWQSVVDGALHGRFARVALATLDAPP